MILSLTSLPASPSRWLALLGALLAFTLSCGGGDADETKEEMLWLKHQGAEMPVLVRGDFRSDVILLIVHGGAGGNAGVYIQDFRPTLEPHYMVAYWDQRHAGNAAGAFSKEEFSPQNALALMALDMKLVLDMLRARYGEEKKIFALGHSWGVQLGTKYLIDHGGAQQLDGWIAVNGPHSAYAEYEARVEFIRHFSEEMIRRDVPFEASSILRTASFSSPQQALAWINANDPLTTWDQLDVAWWLAGEIQQQYVSPTYVYPAQEERFGPSGERSILSGPYSVLASQRNSRRTGALINNSVEETSIQEFYDLTPEMDRITLPTALLWGYYDEILAAGSAFAYRSAIATPPEQITLEFYDAAHSPMLDVPRAFGQDVVDFIELNRGH